MSIWNLRRNKADIPKMSKALNIREPVACVLANRKIGTYEQAEKFLFCDKSKLYDFKLFKDADKGIKIVSDSIIKNKKIAVYGDYDVDGVMSTTILYKTLKYLNANVMFYLPHRQKEGYGMNIDAIKDLSEMGIEVIITCDNGISAIDEIALAKKLGIITVVIDHHEVQYTENNGEKIINIPLADAIIDAKQPDCDYPFKFLCAAAMCYKFSKTLFEAFEKDFVYDDEFISFAAVATVCDIVDMLDENRIIAKNGLRTINTIKNPGMRALIELTGIGVKDISEYHAGFIIGPCINATGRLESAETAVRLFTEENYSNAVLLASELVNLNNERKSMTQCAVDEIYNTVINSDIKNDNVLVIYNSDIHESIAGIVAGRMKEIFYKPVIVITKSGDLAKGSARSIDSYNMFEELLKCADLFVKFGGHPMAAGISLDFGNIDILRQRLNYNCTLTEKELTRVIRIDKELNFDDIDIVLAQQLESLSPFGKECTMPIFATKNVFIKKMYIIGKKRDIIKFVLGQKCSSNLIEAISFDCYEKFCSETKNICTIEELLSNTAPVFYMDIVYNININRFNQKQSVQINIKDFRIGG